MDPILQVLLSWQFVFFSLAIAAVVYVIRLFVEYMAEVLKRDLSKSHLWNDFLLPVLPILVGVAGALLLKKFPYPGFTANAKGNFLRGDRLIFGLVTGSLSSLLFRSIKALLYQKLVDTIQGLKLPGANTNTVLPTTDTDKLISEEELPKRGQV